MKKSAVRYDRHNDFYKLLGVAPLATAEEIQQAFRKLAKEWHPDLNPERRDWATEQFQRVNEAYNLLSNPELRAVYDQERAKIVRSKSDNNWWDVPHPKQPGYEMPARRPKAAPPKMRPGVWLEQNNLGWLRPTYAAFIDLYESPYRPVLYLLMLVLVGNASFIVFMLTRNEEAAEEANPPVTIIYPTASIDNLPTALPTVIVQAIVRCEPKYVLPILSVEQTVNEIRITASAALGMNAQGERLHLINLSEDQLSAQLLGEWQPAKLIFTTAPAETAIISDLPLGKYLLEWTPVLPDGSLLRPCYQVLDLE